MGRCSTSRSARGQPDRAGDQHRLDPVREPAGDRQEPLQLVADQQDPVPYRRWFGRGSRRRHGRDGRRPSRDTWEAVPNRRSTKVPGAADHGPVPDAVVVQIEHEVADPGRVGVERGVAEGVPEVLADDHRHAGRHRLQDGPAERLDQVRVVEVDEEVEGTQELGGLFGAELEHVPVGRMAAEPVHGDLPAAQEPDPHLAGVRVRVPDLLRVLRPLHRIRPPVPADHRDVAAVPVRSVHHCSTSMISCQSVRGSRTSGVGRRICSRTCELIGAHSTPAPK